MSGQLRYLHTREDMEHHSHRYDTDSIVSATDEVAESDYLSEQVLTEQISMLKAEIRAAREKDLETLSQITKVILLVVQKADIIAATNSLHSEATLATAQDMFWIKCWIAAVGLVALLALLFTLQKDVALLRGYI
ncbi:uncharacterized protein VDAG_07823 [Verticillium dahliae VdLs.17]|uniref:Uncharacterized protein n=2 Tax=Verticillium dahliae TaxID=27337 RepID=G2XCE1_VERDV|nr:uncharacterized protein VDAG_07823 [Verticillium dahliae VdLs.17]EGY16659.1 hypothetical protein VDAG_07823 [Verticillium dahliae VdLs.17]KAH6675195.1 hypothetical protein EV126DRAFT_351652 [Verticillium dahliae]KAH6706971.1 hypothetical protein EV126DRAFT_332811 [Verticillium dahliae]